MQQLALQLYTAIVPLQQQVRTQARVSSSGSDFIRDMQIE